MTWIENLLVDGKNLEENYRALENKRKEDVQDGTREGDP